MTVTGATARVCVLLPALSACLAGAPSATTTTSVTPATHKFPIVNGPHAVDCNVCHGSFQSFEQFSCLNCHGHEQALTDMLHVSLPRQAAGYRYDSAACLGCHAGGSRVPYDHAGLTVSCATCHDTGTPFDPLPVAGKGLDGGAFTHPPKGGNDCRACHGMATWLGAGNAPPGLAHDPAQNISVDELVPAYAGTSISGFTPETETLSMEMNHQTNEVAAATLSNCAGCHENAPSGDYFPGLLHSSLENAVPVIAQPTQCMDCHIGAMPSGFVGPTATNPARTPASGEMKHDAVVWTNGKPTGTSAVPYDCAICHQSPSKALDATWATNQSGTTPALFHSSITAAKLPQPTSCVDCHANSRPVILLTSATASLPAGLQFDHGGAAALGDCGSCHTGSATSLTSWSQGKFHLAGSATPTTCLPCHAGERPTTTTGWVNTTYTSSPFDYVTNASGITHGAGQDCALCHANAGTGVWGSTQNWARGSFMHGPQTISRTTCVACHSTQRPATVITPPGFDHSVNGTGDCLGCHQATVQAGKYVNYVNPTTRTWPGGDWQNGIGYPGSTLVGSPSQFITVTETNLSRTGSTNLVTSTTSVSTTYYNMMLHVSVALPAALNAGPTATPDYTKCWHCHTNTNGTVTSYAEGKYHASLTNYTGTPGGTVTPFPQPTSGCADCHSQMRPAGIVAKNGSDLQSMDHDATLSSGASVAAMDCSACHRNAGVTWADGAPAQAPLFHANIGASVPQDCTLCHYPLMADAPKADLTNGVRYLMRHASGQITFQACQTCHSTALSKAKTTPIAATLWSGGAYHASLASQPLACLDCHSITKPSASTQSSFAYTLAMGSTTTNQAQWMNHSSTAVAGKDCVVCHASDVKITGSAWSKAAKYHSAVSAPATCKECHGLTNGNGAVAGTKNNLPVGLTNSSTLTTASSVASTGVPAGTYDQITHTDVNVSGRDCNFCHTQKGISTAAGIQGKEWAQADFHKYFTSANPLVINGTTGRCSNCHMNVKPGATFTAFNHSAFTATSGTQDCSSCHSWPGTGTAASPNWLGAGASPMYISVGGFTIAQPPATTATVQMGVSSLPHPAVAAGVLCTMCHTNAAGGKGAIGYDHASTLISKNCASCHEAGTNLVGTLWNGATSETAGAGDSRPFTLTSVSYKGRNLTYAKHFYPVDCNQCHNAPTGISVVNTGAAYTSAWVFPHKESKMTNPSTCKMCHPNGIP